VRRFLIFVFLLLFLANGCRKKPQSQVEADVTRPPEKWLEREPVKLLRDYVRVDTTLEQGEEAGAKFLRTIFDCDGIETEILCPAPKRCNLVARLPGKTRQGTLLLLNHIDVAPVAGQTWQEAKPFAGKIKGGYLYGRGAYDMKSLAVAQALGMRNLKRRGIVPASDVLFIGEADEEIGQKWGIRWILENRPDLLAGVENALNEGGTAEVILRDVRFFGIETIQAGVAMAEFESPTAAPLAELARKWPKLHSAVVAPDPQVRIAFDLLANHLVSPLTDPLRHLDRVLRNPAELARLPDRYGSFLQARIYWSGQGSYRTESNDTKFGGYVVVSVPPGMDPGDFLRPILEGAVAAGIRVTRSFSGGPTVGSPYPTAFTELIRRVIEGHFPGVPFGPAPAVGGFTTSALLRQRGYPTYGFSPIPMNITDSVRRHGPNERVYLRDYLKGVETFEDVLEEFALAPPARGLSSKRVEN
jgi:acetylornithine deacetylase/succinyl-diaminopimelate desuccinylase-like protein